VNAGLAARRFLVTGKVQGVFFRASTVRIAEQLGLRGYARNLPDGSVEVLALGEPPSLAGLAEWLRKGPPLASVSAVAEHVEDAAAYRNIADFSAS
jgi:acylphosphatase